jgi:hypothetical protein
MYEKKKRKGKKRKTCPGSPKEFEEVPYRPGSAFN